MSDITILIPTSPIPSHPSTAILDETISNIRKYTDALIIIMCDGVHSSLNHRKEAYLEYIEAIRNKYKNTAVMVFGGHQHQAFMTREILKHVQTELILFNEHDCSPIGEIPFEEICAMVKDSEEINCIRFNIFDQIPYEHSYLMLGGEIRDGIPLQRTIQWSQRPHIAKKAWYQDILNAHFGKNDKTMIEDVMHGVVQVEYDRMKRDTFGLAIYTPDTPSQLRSYHSDGRGADEKIIYG
jgi:hypothetical protein